MALTRDINLGLYDSLPECKTELPVLTASTLFAGSAVGESSSTGYVRALVAGDAFKGFAAEGVVNAGASGAARVPVIRQGELEATISGASVASLGDSVYMSDDGTFTLASTGNSLVGKVSRHISGTTVVVLFQAAELRSL